MCSCEGSVLFHKFSHWLTICHSFVTLCYLGKDKCLRRLWFVLYFLVGFFSDGFLLDLGNEYIFDQLSIFFAFFKLYLLDTLFDFLLLFPFQLLLL